MYTTRELKQCVNSLFFRYTPLGLYRN